MFGWFQNKSTRAFVSTTTNNTATSRKRRSPQQQQQQQQPLPSCKLYDLCIDRDWQAVNDHAKQHPIDGSYQDFHGHDGGATPLMLACEDRAPLETIQILLQSYPEATRIANRNGNIPLHVGCHCGAYKNVLEALLDQDVESVFCQTKWGKTPLTALCDGFTSSSHLEIIPEELMWSKIKVLLKAVAQCEKKLPKGRNKNHKNQPQTRNDNPTIHDNDNDNNNNNNNKNHHNDDDDDGDDGLEETEKWHLLHAAVSLGAIGCPKQAFDMTLAKHPHAVFQTDSQGRLPLHIAAGPCQWRWPKLKRAYKPREGYVFDALLLRNREAARVPDPHNHGRMPLHLALANGHTWEGGVEALFGAAPEYISVEDPVTGLVPFLLAAVPVGETNTSLTTIYSLLCAQPDLISSFDFETVLPVVPLDSDNGDTTTNDGTQHHDNISSMSSTAWTSKLRAARSLDMKHLATFVAFSAVAIACVRSILTTTTKV